MKNQLMKVIKNPSILKNIPFKIKVMFDWTNLKIKAVSSKIDLSVGRNVQLIQKVVLTGNGSLTIRDSVIFGSKKGGYFQKGYCELQPRYKDSEIFIGNRVSINNNLFILSARRVEIGDFTLIGEGVMIMDYDAHGLHPDERRTSIGKIQPVKIGENCWIGSRATILSGTSIGKNSIVGAGAVVKGEIPANVVVAGNPAKIVRNLT